LDGTLVQSVPPCVTSGSPSAPPGPSQQSISSERQPCSSWRAYIAADDAERSWSPSRYELCDDATQ